MRLRPTAFLLCLLLAPALRAEDGYRLWLRYDRVSNDLLRAAYVAALPRVDLAVPSGHTNPVTTAARDELREGLAQLLGGEVPVRVVRQDDPGLLPPPEGYRILTAAKAPLRIVANEDAGILYGAFALLRALEMQRPAGELSALSAPRIQRRLLDHWDNLDGTVERGYAGRSLWNWFTLPDYLDPRYRDYARACASVGINGAVLTNVNADPLALTAPYLAKAAALAGVFRAYGVRVYLTARFSAPIELGGLKTADPLDPGVIRWWNAKADEIYHLIPDFGGLLVKANSEGQPGPQDYGRTHADGANLLAEAVGRHGGIVMWRAFVYRAGASDDRTKQAYEEFKPLDGKFRDNVLLQIKNGPLDFQPREPFHPLFGAMPRTPLALEVQLTQEYLGGSIYLAYLAPLYKEVLDADTFRPTAGSTVAQVVDGTLDHHRLSAMAGVANVGADRDWTGHPLAAANWYAFGRLAWDPGLGSDAIADEWIRQTFGNQPEVVTTLSALLLGSREVVVDSMMPLGLHHIMARDHHYGPGPWVDGGRADWTAVYYHRASTEGVGFDRTATGSNALAQYSPEVARAWGDLATCPDGLLLWFHHLPWDYPMHSGRSLWAEVCTRYQRGVDGVRTEKRQWESLRNMVDPERWAHVEALLQREERDAAFWRDSCILYFQQFSKRPIPPGVERPAHPLDYYEAVQLHDVPGSPDSR